MSRSAAPKRQLTLLAVLSVLFTLCLSPTLVLGEPRPNQVEVPSADLLDVGLQQGSFEDAAAGREAEVFGEQPAIAEDPALGRSSATFTGSNAVRYDFTDAYDVDALTVECTIRVDGPASGIDDRNNFCGTKEAGGFSLNAGDQAKVLLNLGNGDYSTVAADILPGVWYHVVGVWDGATLVLYLNGEKVDETPAQGSGIKVPTSQYLFLGADTDPTGEPEYLGTGQLAQAAVYSQALAADQVAARHTEIFRDRTGDVPSVEILSPDSASTLRTATVLDAQVDHADLLARELSFQLDDQDVSLGDEIGPGLSAGDHRLSYTGRDRFGAPVEGTETFSSAAIPTPAGTSQTTTEDSAQLSARATHPTGGQLRTTFLQGAVQQARQAEVGTIDAAEYDRRTGVAGDVTLKDPADLKDQLRPGDGQQADSPTTDQISALRADLEYTAAGQSVVWRGSVAPDRQVDLLLLNTDTGRYQIVDSARGSSDQEVELSATAGDANNDDGIIRTLVVGVDPFADDLDEPVQDAFGDPKDFDFSLMHITDPQYLVAGSISKKNPEERAVWKAGYQDSYRWLAQHAEEYNVGFVGLTGDLVDSWRQSDTDRDRAVAEYEVASESQKILDDTGIPNAVLPGDHDNRSGTDNGTDSLYNTYFGPERYSELAQGEGWRQRGAEYHPWKEGDNANNYVLFSAEGEDFVVVSLGYHVTEEEADWADGVFAKYPGRNGIIMTHAAHQTSTQPDGRNGARRPDGELISKRIMEKNPNVILLLGGHVTGSTINVRTDVGQNGNNVVELTHDYQGYRISSDKLGITDLGDYDGDTPVTYGATFFRLLQFDLKRGELNVDTYSAHLDEFGATPYDTGDRYNGTEDDFRVPIQLQGRRTSFSTDSLTGITPTSKVIDTVTHDSDVAATATWEHLAGERTFGWYAVTRDAGGDADSPASVRATALGRGGPETDGIVQFDLFSLAG